MIYTPLYGFKYFYQMLIIFKQIFRDGTQTGTTSLTQSGSGSNGKEDVPQDCSLTTGCNLESYPRVEQIDR